MSLIPIKTAFFSVADKTHLARLARALHDKGVTLIASDGTAQAIKNEKLPVKTVESLTQMPPLFGGRVKTLHPAIHGAILAKGDSPQDTKDLRSLSMPLIDVVVVNLYPFAEQLKKSQEDEVLVEFIDIGGPALMRAAAKNHQRTVILSSPQQYDDFLTHIAQHDGKSDLAFRQQCAHQAFAHTCHYDAAISEWLANDQKDTPLPATLTLRAQRAQMMRYGENPHQKGAFYKLASPFGAPPCILDLTQWQGKELSWNNIHDADHAVSLARSLPQPSAVVIKHASPCGASHAANLHEATRNAIGSDPVSAFGGIIALNAPLDKASADIIKEGFFEVIIAPHMDEDALPILQSKKNMRLLSGEALFADKHDSLNIRSVQGGLLIQESDHAPTDSSQWSLKTGHAPPSMDDLTFAWQLVRGVRSNAIAIVKKGQALGIGGGATSRIDALTHAIAKAHAIHGAASLQGASLASDAFFPFSDAITHAAQAGIQFIVASGGSMRDEEVIAEAQQHKLTLYFTHKRHFKH